MWEEGSGIAANRLNDLKGTPGPLETCLAWMDQLSQSVILSSLALWFPHLLGLEVENYFFESKLTPPVALKPTLFEGLVQNSGVLMWVWGNKKEGRESLKPPAGLCLSSP